MSHLIWCNLWVMHQQRLAYHVWLYVAFLMISAQNAYLAWQPKNATLFMKLCGRENGSRLILPDKTGL